MQQGSPSPETVPEPADGPSQAVMAHAAPFVMWIFLMHMLGDPAGWKYAVNSVVGVGMLAWFRPWRWYGPLLPATLPLAVVAGLAVFVAWVGFESDWMARTFPVLHDTYVRWAVLPLGEVRPIVDDPPYAPSSTGWFLTLVRIAGSALVIAVAEEFFWRGFLYRWIQGKDFRTVDPGKYDAISFWMIALVFGIEHREWLAGMVAGVVYGWLYLKTRNIWVPAVAHVITNLALGLYVVGTGAWHFW